MSDRLQELRRQRALVAEHLAWLDREIAAAAGNAASPAPAQPAPAQPAPAKSAVLPSPAPAPTPPIATAPKPAAGTSPQHETETAAAADAILDEYRVAPDSMKSDVKKGCFLYFFGALAFVALVIAVLYFAFQRK